jgi:hypothetical protein
MGQRLVRFQIARLTQKWFGTWISRSTCSTVESAGTLKSVRGSVAGGERAVFGVIAFVVVMAVTMIAKAFTRPDDQGERWPFGNPNENNYMSVRCPTCGATDYCRTKSGAEAYKPHVARLQAFEQRQREKRLAEEKKSTRPSGLQEFAGDQGVEDEQFQQEVRRRYGETVQLRSHQTVAGVSHLNRDRTRRTTIIKRCTPLEALKLVAESDNPVDPMAVAVCRSDGAQLGYLPARCAAELHAEVCDPQSGLVAIFKRHNLHPETGTVVGCVILLAQIPPA